MQLYHDEDETSSVDTLVPQYCYDCSLCKGQSVEAKVDCLECGGTGWAPPCGVEPTCKCFDCGRDLWQSPRGPKWYQNLNTDRALCAWCMKAKGLFKKPRRERTIRASKRYL